LLVVFFKVITASVAILAAFWRLAMEAMAPAASLGAGKLA
jgi:hypothetical protein